MTTIEDILSIAHTAAARGDMAEAVQAYQRLAAIFPEDKKAIWQAANELKACGQSHEAINVLEAGLAHNPTSIALLSLTAEIHLEISSPTSAIPHLERITALLPNQDSSWSNLEAAKSKADQQSKSVGQLPAEVKVMLELAFSADQMQRYDEARTNYEAVLEQDPDNLLALSRLLTFDGIEGRLSEADKRH